MIIELEKRELRKRLERYKSSSYKLEVCLYTSSEYYDSIEDIDLLVDIYKINGEYLDTVTYACAVEGDIAISKEKKKLYTYLKKHLDNVALGEDYSM